MQSKPVMNPTLLHTLQSVSPDTLLSTLYDFCLRADHAFVKRLRTSLDSPRFADCRNVVSFIEHFNLQLKATEAHEFVMLPPGTYTHDTLPYGPSRLGIRRGDIAYLATEGHGVVEVHVSNLSYVPDSPTVYRGTKPPSETSSTSVKKLIRRGQPCAVPAVGDRLKDDFGLRYTVTTETLPRMLELAKTLSFTYAK